MTRSKQSIILLCSLLFAVLLAGCLPAATIATAAPGGSKGARTAPTTSTTVAPTTTTTVKPTTTTTVAPTTTTTVAPTPSPSGFVHPGVFLGQADIDFVRAKIAAGQEPWKSALAKLQNTGSSTAVPGRATTRYSSLSYVPKPVPVVQAPGSTNRAWINANPQYGYQITGDMEHLDDARAAYTQALLWAYTRNQANANKAIEIMNAWSSTLTEIKFDQPRRPDNGSQLYDNGMLQAGWAGTLWARAAEIIRYTGAGWSQTGISNMERMLTNVVLPLTINSWPTGTNGILTWTEATINIGVFTNNRSAFDAGVATWRKKVPMSIYLPTDGARPIAPNDYWNTDARMKQLWHNPTQYISGLEVETGRDMSHTMMGLGALSNAAQTAGLQGVDLFGAEKTRIVASYELHARYINEYLDKVASLGGAQPPADWKPTGWVSPPFALAGEGYKAGWEVAYSHYAALGVSMPQTKRLVERVRPSGPGLHLSWETLTSAR